MHVWSSRAVVCEPRRPGLVGPPGFHTTAREPKCAHFRVQAFRNTTQIQRKGHPREREKNENCDGRREKKKSKILGGPAEGCPAEGLSGGGGVSAEGGSGGRLSSGNGVHRRGGSAGFRVQFRFWGRTQKQNKNKMKREMSEKTKQKSKEREKHSQNHCSTFGQFFSTSANFDFGQFNFGQLAEVELSEVESSRSRASSASRGLHRNKVMRANSGFFRPPCGTHQVCGVQVQGLGLGVLVLRVKGRRV